MLLGEVDEGDFKFDDLATVLFILFVFLVVILLANVLIAIVTDSYGVIRNERSAIVFWSNQLDVIGKYIGCLKLCSLPACSLNFIYDMTNCQQLKWTYFQMGQLQGDFVVIRVTYLLLK